MRTVARILYTKLTSNSTVNRKKRFLFICFLSRVSHVAFSFLDAKPIATAWKTVGYTVDRRYLVTGLTPNQAYRVRVSVRNAVGWSGYSIASSEFRLHSGKCFQATGVERVMTCNLPICSLRANRQHQPVTG